MNAAAPRILILEDDGEEAGLISRAIAAQHPDWKLEFASRGQEALHRLNTEPFDAVLVDHQLPDMSGLTFIREITSRSLDVAVVFHVPFGNQQMYVDALDAGASDCVQKSAVMYSHLGVHLASSIQALQIRRRVRQSLQDLIQSERQAALSQLSLALRHEINNPLAALCAYVELWMNEARNQPDIYRRLEQIYAEAMRIRDVVRKTEDVKDELQEYLPGMKMIKLRDQSEPAADPGTHHPHPAPPPSA